MRQQVGTEEQALEGLWSLLCVTLGESCLYTNSGQQAVQQGAVQTSAAQSSQWLFGCKLSLMRQILFSFPLTQKLSLITCLKHFNMIYQKIRMRSFQLVFVEEMFLEYLGKGSKIWLCKVNVSDLCICVKHVQHSGILLK